MKSVLATAMAAAVILALPVQSTCGCTIDVLEELALPQTDKYIVYTENTIHPEDNILYFPVSIYSTEYNHFNATDIIITYDPTVLHFEGIDSSDYFVAEETGAIRIMRFGSDVSIGFGFSAQFAALKNESTYITLDSACVDNAEHAAYQNIMEAEVISTQTLVCFG